MRYAIVLLALAGLIPVTGVHAQESLCNPCVDIPPHLYENNIPGERPRLRRATTVVTAEQMRALGIVTVDDLNAQLPGVGVAIPGLRFVGATAATEYFSFGGELERLRWTIAELAPELDRIVEYVSERTGVRMSRRIVVHLAAPEPGNASRNCPQRGMAVNVARMTADFGLTGLTPDITIFVGPATTRQQLFGVLAHEVGHVLMFQWLGADVDMPGVAMGEGYATWAAGRYVTEWYGIDSLRSAVARLIRTNELVPPAATVGPYYSVPADSEAAPVGEQECVARRDRLYTEWGGFVEYLVGLDSADTLLALLRTAPAAAVTVPPPWGNLDFRSVYGRDLAALIDDWLAATAAAAD